MNGFFREGFEKTALSTEEKRQYIKDKQFSKKLIYGGNAVVAGGAGAALGAAGAGLSILRALAHGAPGVPGAGKALMRGALGSGTLGTIGGLALGHGIHKKTTKILDNFSAEEIDELYNALKKKERG